MIESIGHVVSELVLGVIAIFLAALVRRKWRQIQSRRKEAAESRMPLAKRVAENPLIRQFLTTITIDMRLRVYGNRAMFGGCLFLATVATLALLHSPFPGWWFWAGCSELVFFVVFAIVYYLRAERLDGDVILYTKILDTAWKLESQTTPSQQADANQPQQP